MTDHWLFFLDADGWLVGPESAPFPGEAHALNTALAELRDEAQAAEPVPRGSRSDERPRARTAERRVAAATQLLHAAGTHRPSR